MPYWTTAKPVQSVAAHILKWIEDSLVAIEYDANGVVLLCLLLTVKMDNFEFIHQ